MTLKRYKSDFDHSYSFGVSPTLELAKYQPQALTQVILTPKSYLNSGVIKLNELCATHHISITENESVLTRLGATPNTLAMGVFTKFTTNLDPAANHVVLVNPQDMGNLGSIIRTLVGFGIPNLAIIKPAVDIFDPKVVRASMGAVFQLNFSYFENFSAYAEAFPRNYYPFMTSAKTLLPITKPVSLYSFIFGSESDGLPDDFLHIGTPVRIPQTPKIDSLNLSTAVAIAAYAAYTDSENDQ
jgi:RNA methyltransferase, TrmH family